MKAVSRVVKNVSRVVAASAVALLGSAGAAGEERRPASRTPIRDSLDRVIEQVVLSHLGPCDLAARKGIPCFPTGIEQEGPRFSVAEALRRYRGTGSAAPGVPTVSEIQSQMSGAMQSASGGVSTDPVCGAKNLWRKISGRTTTYHLYRTWDERGERPLLTDRKLDADDYQTNPQFRFEYIGSFGGECAAVAAWNKALREAVGRQAEAEEPVDDPPAREPPP